MKRFLLILLFFAMVGLVFWNATLRPKLTAVERGRRLAERTGCFGCHGPDGMEGTPNPGSTGQKVPSYRALMMYAKGPEDVREWIRDGVTASHKKSHTHHADREASALRMPAFGKRLSSRQIDDLVQYVMAASGMEAPSDSTALAGRDRVRELGCTGCHGMDGRYGRTNPRSLKGYIPPWDGADFPELVRNRAEFDEWVKNGNTQRFKSNPMAMYFLRRAMLHMPHFERFLKPGDLDAMWGYVQWLRLGRPMPVEPDGETGAAAGDGSGEGAADSSDSAATDAAK